MKSAISCRYKVQIEVHSVRSTVANYMSNEHYYDVKNSET